MASSPTEQVGRNRSTSTGDSELPEHEHKRPRLDTAAEGSPNNSKPVQNTSLTMETNNRDLSQLNDPRLHTPPSRTISPDGGPLLASPTSKVTINTRPLSAQSAAMDVVTDNAKVDLQSRIQMAATDKSKSESPVVVNVSDTESTKHAAGNASEPISIPSSPAESVVIQIGDPEDIEDVSESTTWSTISGTEIADAVSGTPPQLHCSMPWLNGNSKAEIQDLFQQIVELLEKGSSEDFDNFWSQLLQWITSLPILLNRHNLQSLVDDLEILHQLPRLLIAILKRRSPLPSVVQDADLIQFIKAFAHVAIYTMNLDVRRLVTLGDAVTVGTLPVALSLDYLRHLCTMLAPPNNSYLYTNLRTQRNIQEKEFSSRIATVLFYDDVHKPFQALSDLFNELDHTLPSNSQSRTSLLSIVQCYRSFLNVVKVNGTSLNEQQREALRKITHQFVTKTFEALQQAVTKQHPWLTIENNNTCLDAYCRLCSITIQLFPEVADDVFRIARIEQREFDSHELSDLAQWAFRLTLLRLMIQHGRMELRVFCIDAMASDLVNIWTRFNNWSTPRRVSLLDLVVDFLKGNEMVHYLLGVDSHPQIVQKSPNVIGFLCISNNWLPADTDIAWKAVLQSHDHRAVAAVVDVLRANVPHLNLESLLYFYEKLSDFPFERLDARVLDFIIVLFNATLQKINIADGREQQVNVTVVRLCFYLLCEAHVPTRCSTELTQQLQGAILNFLMSDANNPHGRRVMNMAEADREALISMICEDVSTHNDHATGSIIGMAALLSSLDVLTASRLITTCDFAKLLLNDILHLSSRNSAEASLPEKALYFEYDARFSCMLFMIVNTPIVFDRELYESFWANVLTSDLPHEIRSRAWNVLASAYERSTSLNPFLQFVSEQFMERLPSSALNEAVLNFAKSSVEFELQYRTEMMERSDEYLHIPSMERIWRVMLEAEAESVQNEASDFVIKTYLDSNVIISRSAASIERTHAALVDRCIQTVIDSARLLKPPSSAVTGMPDGDASMSNDLPSQPETHLHRSLMLLRKFLNGLKSRPRWRLSSPTILAPALRNFQRRGEPVELTLGIVNHPEIRSDKQPWTVGEDNTGDELWQFLTNLTGWSQIHFIKAGARLHLQHNESTLKELKIGQGPVMISRVMGSATTGLSRSVRAASPVDSKIMHHFGELYALLESNERVAKAIYDFLTMFSSQEAIVAEIKSKTLPANSLLPINKPFKLLYYATALRSCIEEESFSSSPDVDFLLYAVRTIVTTLQHIQAIEADPSLRMTILLGIIETLLLALRAKVPDDTSKAYFPDGEPLVRQFLQSWASVQQLDTDTEHQLSQRALCRHFFDVMIEMTLHDDRLWHLLTSDASFEQILRSAFLLDTNQENRRSILDVILRLAGTGNNKAALKARDSRSPRGRFSEETVTRELQQLWQTIYPSFAQACEYPSTCQEMFEAAVAIFEVVSKKLDENSLLNSYTRFRELLLQQHDPSRKTFCVNEYVPCGLAKLILQCISSLTAHNVALPDAVELARSIYQQFLFPPLSDAESASLLYQNIPIVDSESRTALYDVVVSLCHSTDCLQVVTTELEETSIDENAFLPNMSNERKALRSDQGYAGLRNLSNTCYLNSLFSQLFMNVKFRELIIGINVIDQSKQKLVHELANVFANMQSSWEKYITPEAAVQSITQYTGEEIDVTVQMDVDEFFNLLFDRLETQIVDPDAREVFKSMYGGQLVQQIKSKECEHVSERLEPFSAVQVEIRGKAGLEEGLAAYVEGEVLQGENKYSCTSCGRHVDAVKRACLKEVPDNLIFNLKRFDYDIMTGTRCKVNDEFQFPERIDMMPYTVDALSNPDKKLPSDVFELVGVIIHSGTAETGHYYSYVRQRPSARSAKDSWVQFNDHDVTKFEVDQMKDLAFGGCDQTFSSLSKFYNGYMLFYQRSSSIKQYSQEYPVFSAGPVIVTLPQELDNQIAQENEICFRRYTAQDPSHAKFIRQIAEQMRPDGESCNKQSVDHTLNDRLMVIILDYIQQVSSRWKEAPEFEETVKLLIEYAKNCPRCAENIVRWFGYVYERPYDRQRHNVLDCILRPFYVVARKHFATLLSLCYSVLFPTLSTDAEEKLGVTDRRRLQKVLAAPLRQVVDNWQVLQRFNRGWDQLFSMLHSIARLGRREAVMMVELGFLEKTLEIIWIHYNSNTRGTPVKLKQDYNMYLQAREKNRSFNHAGVMDLFADLLAFVELGPARRAPRSGTVQTSKEENELLGIVDGGGSIGWIRRIISGRSNADAAALVVKELCDYPDLSDTVGRVLLTGIEESRLLQIAASYIQPCFVYVQNVSQPQLARTMFTKCLACIAESEGIYGGDYLDFIKEGVALQDTVSGFAAQHALAAVFQQLENWAPPLLMAPNDIHRDVRNETLMFLDRILFANLANLSLDEVRLSDRHMTHIRALAFGCNTYASKNFLSTQSRGAAQRSTLQAGQQAQVVRVLGMCMEWLDGDANAEDETLIGECQQTVDDLGLLAQSVEIEGLEGEWRDGSSGELSEMESFEVSP
ncbi:hypothetical protein H2198_006868 [Neophaeococcomyces mojaviensis]|uniref:Uncharacterized protein n=1 Tax=Neophaeococcomyces mojaviensis TaxID=3383035 RepID=A0ACC3A1J9_9EURO|nr:hypothetical protein H2198_006868 [Knufia sp. JES_112]